MILLLLLLSSFSVRTISVVLFFHVIAGKICVLYALKFDRLSLIFSETNNAVSPYWNICFIHGQLNGKC